MDFPKRGDPKVMEAYYNPETGITAVKNRIWTYWEGRRPPIIDLCIRSIQRHNPETYVVGPDDLKSLGVPKSIMDLKPKVSHAHFSDCLRYWLLHTFGGIWIDADCICTGPLDWEDLGSRDLSVVRCIPSLGRVVANPFGGPPQSKILKWCLDTALKMTKDRMAGKSIAYAQTSYGVLAAAIRKYWTPKKDSPVRIREHWRYHRIPWSRAGDYLVRKMDRAHEHGEIYLPTAVLYHLTSKIVQHLAFKTEEFLLENNHLICFLFRKAFNRIRPHRARIVSELIDHFIPTRGVEIGVNRGRMSRLVLQQLPYLHLTGVDLWEKPAPEMERDVEPFYGLGNPAIRKQSRKTAVKWLRLFGNRSRLLQMDSVAAAALFQDNSLDYGFIDADHSYQGCKRDNEAWIRKIRPGGYLMGHDYGHPKFPGVKRAVDECFGLNVETRQDWVWIHKKEG